MRTALALIVLGALSLIMFGCHELNQEEQRQRAADQQWAQFSAQHHCKTLREEKWWESSVIWQCDGGSQVRRRDSD